MLIFDSDTVLDINLLGHHVDKVTTGVDGVRAATRGEPESSQRTMAESSHGGHNEWKCDHNGVYLPETCQFSLTTEARLTSGITTKTR